LESTREILGQYLAGEHGDTSMMADDVVFTIMGTGEAYHGPVAAQQMLHDFYQVAFDALARTTNMIVADGQAFLEGMFEGTHIGEFAGIPATGKKVSVPLCVVYDFEDDKLKRGRVYMEVPVMMAQLGRCRSARVTKHLSGE